jgi:Fe-Mn family superoxide dismutase
MKMMTRREALQATFVLTAASAAAAHFPSLHAQAPAAPSGPYTLPPLPYSFDALEPHLDAKTMEIHHDRHHAAYVTNLNKALATQPGGAPADVAELVRNLSAVPEAIRAAVRNNGGGHLNHSLFWRMMKKGGGGEPKGELATAIDKQFGSYEKFKEALTKAALGQFGSGWAWLTLDEKVLKIESTANQDTPLSQGRVPLLGVDVWEHAYYLKYQNKRADYVAAFYNVIDWDFVTERYLQAGGK